MAAITTRETERKYEADDAVMLPGWGGLSGVEASVGPDELQLEAIYFDTADLTLARAGTTLRHRQGGDDAGWTLKLPAGADTRDEIHIPGPRTQQEPIPQELLSLARSTTRDAPLAPVAMISTTRRRWRLRDVAGHTVIEVVDDQVTAGSVDDPGSATSWREVEIELGEHGDPELLDALERRLVNAGLHRSDAASKLARALGDRLPEPPTVPRLTRKSSAAEIVLAYLRDQADAIRRWDPQVRRETPDSVHQMRVATRRMRSILQAYGRIIDRDRTRGLTDELKWLAAVLGEARDLEVLHGRFDHALRALPDELALGPVSARLTRHFAPREATAKANVIAALNGPRYLRLLQSIDDLLTDPPLTERAARPARKALPRQLARAYRRIHRHMTVAERQPGDHPDRDTQLHEARKAAKRLRYASEAAAPALGKPTRRLGKAAKRFQQLLGDHNDTVVALPVLREIAIEAHAGGENAFTFGLLHRSPPDPAGHFENQVDQHWQRLRRRATG
jgi:CHAD domain-containing protein